jgi:hypothetical protein
VTEKRREQKRESKQNQSDRSKEMRSSGSPDSDDGDQSEVFESSSFDPYLIQAEKVINSIDLDKHVKNLVIAGL